MKLVPSNDPILHREIPIFAGNPQDLVKVAKAMFKIMRAGNGIGLSANQVGLELNMFIMGHEPIQPKIVVINPVVLEVSKDTDFFNEGCLSFPKQYYEIERPQEIKVSYLSLENIIVTQTFNGLWARCFLHEVDHLKGITFDQRVA